MARPKDGVNKSESIRVALEALPDAKAKEIVAHLKGKGVEVTEGLVYQVKKISKKKKKAGRKPGPVSSPPVVVTAPAKVAAPSSNGALPHLPKGVLGVGASIALIKTTAEKVGGWATLKEIVDALQ